MKHPGKIYLIRNGEGHFKIGRTRQRVSERIKQLQVACSTPLEFIAEQEVRHPSKVEAAIHNKYSLYRLEGEWFDLPNEVVELFIEDVIQTDDTFQLLIDMGNPFL